MRHKPFVVRCPIFFAIGPAGYEIRSYAYADDLVTVLAQAKTTVATIMWHQLMSLGQKNECLLLTARYLTSYPSVEALVRTEPISFYIG